MLFLLSSLALHAQSEDKIVTLNEVVVESAKVINKADGQIIYPTEAQKKSSSNGYGILQKLSLPYIRIDAITHTITAIDNKGGVQLRIDGIIADKPELLSLDPKRVRRIEFINAPGVRYGDGIAYVINFVTYRTANGYTLGADLTPSLTTIQGDGTIYGKWNSGKSELSLSYSLSGYKQKSIRNEEKARYTLNDGTCYTIERNDVETLRKALAHNIKLTYNLADTTAYVFQVSLSEAIQHTPGNYSLKRITDGSTQYNATYQERNHISSPILDLYFFRQLTARQSITANTVGTYIATDKKNYFDEGAPYQYTVDGKSKSLLAEAIYENRLKPFTLSAGINYRYKHTQNDYRGDASAPTTLQQNTFYAFTEIAGALRSLRYSLGLGGSGIHYRQANHDYTFWTFRPKATIAYNIAQGLQASYTFQTQERTSRIAMTSDVAIRTNSMEWIAGSPNLKPARDTEHQLRLIYNDQRISSFIEGYYKRCDKPNMAHYERTADNQFVYTQMNQKEIDLLNITAYTSYWLLPERLQIAAYGGLNRCFNYGNDYTHLYTSWFYAASINAYLGHFSLRGYTDNGSRFLESENKGFNEAYTQLSAAYQYKNWQFSLTWSNPFDHHHKTYQAELLNRNLHKLSTGYNRDGGNLVSLNITWRLSRGKAHRSAEKTIQLRDADSGIL